MRVAGITDPLKNSKKLTLDDTQATAMEKVNSTLGSISKLNIAQFGLMLLVIVLKLCFVIMVHYTVGFVCGFFKDKIVSFLRGNDPRWGLPPQAKMAGYTMADLAAWLQPELASGALEITIVGDLDVEATVAAVAQTAGTLPKRQDKTVISAAARLLHPPLSSPVQEFAYDSQDPRGLVMLCWWIPRAYDVKAARRLEVFKEAVQDRLLVKIREEAGAAYSPMAMLSYREEFDDGHFLGAIVQVEPKRADEVVALARAAMADLLKDGVSQDDFDRMVRPLRNEVRDNRRTNGYWSSILAAAQAKPERLDQCRTVVGDFAAMTPAEVNAAARAALDPQRLIVVRLLPRPPAAKP